MFHFGQNWKAYALNALNAAKVEQSKAALARLIDPIDLTGKTFMDVGCGSGLHTVSAAMLGASQVYALDVDPDCIEVTTHTIQRFLQNSAPIHVQQVSILDAATVASLPQVDMVYSWGVLHHTGQMVAAIHAAASRVKPGGSFVIAIYNRHWTSPLWRLIKRQYNRSPRFVQRMMYALFYGVIYTAKFAVTRRDPRQKDRGMDFGYDVIDWIGGYPYEYASIDEIVSLVTRLGFESRRVIPAEVGTGCNEFVFQRRESSPVL